MVKLPHLLGRFQAERRRIPPLLLASKNPRINWHPFLGGVIPFKPWKWPKLANWPINRINEFTYNWCFYAHCANTQNPLKPLFPGFMLELVDFSRFWSIFRPLQKSLIFPRKVINLVLDLSWSVDDVKEVISLIIIMYWWSMMCCCILNIIMLRCWYRYDTMIFRLT